MHCFAFTAVEAATQADWDAFYKATDEIPKKIKGVSRADIKRVAKEILDPRRLNLAIIGPMSKDQRKEIGSLATVD